MNIYPQEDIKVGFTYEKMGFQEEANRLIAAYAEYCENDQSIYQPASMAVLYAYEGSHAEAIEEYEKFAAKNHFQYWMILFMTMDPALDSLKSYPGYDAVIQKIEDRFWENHNRLKETLQEKGLL